MEWHNAFDEANLRFSPDLSDEDLISTISCDSIDCDSIEEWILLSGHPIIDIEIGLIIYENEEQRRRIENCLNIICDVSTDNC